MPGQWCGVLQVMVGYLKLYTTPCYLIDSQCIAETGYCSSFAATLPGEFEMHPVNEAISLFIKRLFRRGQAVFLAGVPSRVSRAG